AWRKTDNWTAFTDGDRTWIQGPAGIQDRPNAERFSWESDAGAPGTTLVGPAPAPAAPPASTAERCAELAPQVAALRARYDQRNAAYSGVQQSLKDAIARGEVVDAGRNAAARAEMQRLSAEARPLATELGEALRAQYTACVAR